ncbi:hypothetical protein B0H19DRAFT_1184834 [Mycena capillaripes]|nr:hypothetical protein B0H19DRAFT_1184834 [Mycena capillaripes]
MNVSPVSVLPLELERDIFETCSLSRPMLIPKLMLVAWHVKEWVEPLLYRTIAVGFAWAIDGSPILTWDVLLSAIRSKPASFFHAVRNLCLLVEDDKWTDVETLLGVCTGLRNLSLSPKLGSTGYGPDMATLISALHLTHLEASSYEITEDASVHIAHYFAQ